MSDRQPTIAVDFDGVIVDYEGWGNTKDFGRPRADVLEALNSLRSEGWKIIVHSCRASTEIAQYLVEHSVPFDEINQNSSFPTGGVKPLATVYWDDRACRYSGDARKDIDIIRNFRTWNARK